ncbi:MAG: heavy metal translocating P-type ATPase [Gemmataceae bacterium]|nr:heavy metal translocating P-type ATPase [Gemmata sp.]MDW8197385.1 heavy metal translocating P-type ATPase [Gemmataceae bacterium]
MPASSLSVASRAAWFCPVCRGVRSLQPGSCPRCGVALEPSWLPADPQRPAVNRRGIVARWVVALLFGLPLMALVVVENGLGEQVISHRIGEKEYLLLQTGLCVPIVVYAATPFFTSMWRALRTRRPTIDTLIGLGILAAFIYSLAAVVYIWWEVEPLAQDTRPDRFDTKLRGGVQQIAPYQEGYLDPFFASAALITLLALFGKLLEIAARERSQAALQKLTPLAAKTARVVLPNGNEEERDITQIQPGDRVRVQPGERIPVDGIIREGTSTIDEAMLTGEVTRAERGPGGRVLAGSENGLRPITVEVIHAGAETLLDQVIGLVNQAQARRAAFERTTDRLVAWYIPTILTIAAITAIVWSIVGPPEAKFTYAAICAVAVLVVACPCAAGLATSAAVWVGMRRAARAGLLFRDPVSLESLAAIDTMLFDKTGTLTEGKLHLLAVVPNTGVSENEVLVAAAAVERGSEHPVGLAIVWEAYRRKVDIPIATDVEAVIGQGIRGTVRGQRVAVGRLGFIQESGVHSDLMLGEALTFRHRGQSVVFVGEGTRCLGLIVMNDPLRPGASEAIEQLRREGLRVVLVTGDHAETAQGVAATVGIDEVVADASPVHKVALVQQHKGQGRLVAMCGDGVNDAPALVAADIGIALGSGTGAAIGTAGLTLLQSDLQAILAARRLSQATVTTIRWNLGFAFAFNVLAIPIAAGLLVPLGGGLINSTWALAANGIGSLAVLLNSLRLNFRRLEIRTPAPAS